MFHAVPSLARSCRGLFLLMETCGGGGGSAVTVPLIYLGLIYRLLLHSSFERTYLCVHAVVKEVYCANYANKAVPSHLVYLLGDEEFFESFKWERV